MKATRSWVFIMLSHIVYHYILIVAYCCRCLKGPCDHLRGPMTISEATRLPLAHQSVTRSFIWLAAIATGVIVTNLFAPQILVGLIGPGLGMTAQQAGMIS